MELTVKELYMHVILIVMIIIIIIMICSRRFKHCVKSEVDRLG